MFDAIRRWLKREPRGKAAPQPYTDAHHTQSYRFGVGGGYGATKWGGLRPPALLPTKLFHKGRRIWRDARHQPRSKYQPHQGAQECARRLARGDAGFHNAYRRGLYESDQDGAQEVVRAVARVSAQARQPHPSWHGAGRALFGL